MITITQWAADWGLSIPEVALLDLQARIQGQLPEAAPAMPGRSEAAVSAELELRARREFGGLLLRNNSGAWPDPKTGRLVRYGLGNVSKQFNEQFKSPDYVGGRPVLITQEHVGHTFCQLWLVEAKEGNWVPGQDAKREESQQRFGDLFLAMGAQFQFFNGGELL